MGDHPPQGTGAIPGDPMSLTPAERLIVQALIINDLTPFAGANIAAILADTVTIAWGDITGIVNDIGVFPTANYATLAAYVEDVRTRLIAIVTDTGAITWGDITGIVNDIGVFPTANYATLAAYVEDIRTRLMVIQALIDSVEAVGPYNYADAGGEQDVYTDAVTTRRRIWVVVSNRNMTQNGKFRIYRKVDGANYDLYIEEAVLVAAGSERAWDREFTTNQHWKISYEEDVDEGANRNIPYNVITQVIE